MTAVLGCIADDFTGATDLAGLLARSGAPVSLRIGVPSEPASNAVAFEVIALKIRTAPAEMAVSQAREALAWLKNAGATRFFWKYCSTFDSTPSGNIGPVAEALMADLGVSQTIYCPAFPENGRTVFMANLFVGRLPLSESPMKDHPLTPMRDSNLMRLLEPQVTLPVGMIDHPTVAKGVTALREYLAGLQGDGIAHVIVDAVCDADLEVIARACFDLPLMTGGSAVAGSLPDIYRLGGMLSAETEPSARPPLPNGSIVLSGSCSAMTRAQVAAFIKRGGPALRLDPVQLDREGPASALAWLAAQEPGATPIVYATAEPEEVRAAQERLGADKAGDTVERALAAIAVAARNQGTRRFVIAGGETSGAITQALGVERLDVGPEIAPGVPWCFAVSAGQPIAITLKSGNFGAEDFFSDALAKLETT